MPEPLDESDNRIFNMNHVFGLDSDDGSDPEDARISGDSNIRYCSTSTVINQKISQMAGDSIDNTVQEHSADKRQSMRGFTLFH